MEKYFQNLKGKNIHVVGIGGVEGSAIAEFLASKGITNITAHDFSENKEELQANFLKTHLGITKPERFREFSHLMNLGIRINYKDKYLEGIAGADLVFVPSSWYLYQPNFPRLAEAQKAGVPFSSITKLYFDLAPAAIISVTGTKGKGTTSRLVYDILKLASERKEIKGKVYIGGNDRSASQSLKALPQMAEEDVLVLETSNRQLAIGLKKSPHIGIITNITPDHLTEHGGFENYIKIKRSLIEYQKEGDWAVLNFDNEITRRFADEFPQTAFLFSRLSEPIGRGSFVKDGSIFVKNGGEAEKVCDLSDVKILGLHNVENVLAAIAAAYLYGIPAETIKEAVAGFKGLKHRIELIGEYGGARFYDDLASTTPESAVAALLALSSGDRAASGGKLVLVAGGDDKGGAYEELAKMILEKADLLVLLPGSGTEKIKSLLLKSAFSADKMNECKDLPAALDKIKSQIKTGDTILISPAGAHFQSRYADVLNKPLRRLAAEIFGSES